MNGQPPTDGTTPGRGRIVAGLLRPALAEQRRICLFACDDFPRDDDHLGRDLSLLTIVDHDTQRADALRDRFGQMIVVETAEPDIFLHKQARLGEAFDLIIVPDLVDSLTDQALADLVPTLTACLRAGGRLALIASQPGVASGGRSFGDLAKLLEHAASGCQFSGRTFGTLILIELASSSSS